MEIKTKIINGLSEVPRVATDNEIGIVWKIEPAKMDEAELAMLFQKTKKHPNIPVGFELADQTVYREKGSRYAYAVSLFKEVGPEVKIDLRRKRK